MTDPSPLLGLMRFLDELHERVERTWWGAVATDARFPRLWESNYAAVDVGDPDLSLREVRETLHPALREAGVTHEYVWIMKPRATGRLLADLAAEGRLLQWDDLMGHGPRARIPEPIHRVEELVDLDEGFWQRERSTLREFGITEPDVVEEVMRRQREVAMPAGKRWFVAHEGGELAGEGSILIHGGAAFVDDVLTFPRFRRRGVARSVVATMVRAARDEGADQTYLFADQPGPVQLYRGLGFEVVERVAASLAPLPGSAAAEAPPVGSERSTGSGPGRPR